MQLAVVQCRTPRGELDRAIVHRCFRARKTIILIFSFLYVSIIFIPSFLIFVRHLLFLLFIFLLTFFLFLSFVTFVVFIFYVFPLFYA